MTPSNPDNNQPLIYRIADALGVFHLVAPVNHTHTYSDIPGLADDLSELWAGLNEKASQEAMTEALEGKQNTLIFDTTPTTNSTNPVTSGGVATALAGKAAVDHSHTNIHDGENNSLSVGEGYVAIELYDGKSGGQLEFTVDNLPNLHRALQDPDTTPTANSTKLVTSGGVKEALDKKAPVSHSHAADEVDGLKVSKLDYVGTAIDVDELEIDGMRRFQLTNDSNISTSIDAMFTSTGSQIAVNRNGSVTLDDGDFAIITIDFVDDHGNGMYAISIDGVFTPPTQP